MKKHYSHSANTHIDINCHIKFSVAEEINWKLPPTKRSQKDL